MLSKKLLEILSHEVNSGLTIMSSGNEGAHLSNSWNHYVTVFDEQLLIPVGGMNTTEKNISYNPEVVLSISNPQVQGYQYPGTGVIVNGTAQFIESGDEFDKMKLNFPWMRALLTISVSTVIQTL